VQQALAELGQGNSFGELALKNEEPRAATIIATELCWLITLDKATYQEVVMAY